MLIIMFPLYSYPLPAIISRHDHPVWIKRYRVVIWSEHRNFYFLLPADQSKTERNHCPFRKPLFVCLQFEILKSKKILTIFFENPMEFFHWFFCSKREKLSNKINRQCIFTQAIKGHLKSHQILIIPAVKLNGSRKTYDSILLIFVYLLQPKQVAKNRLQSCLKHISRRYWAVVNWFGMI